METSRFIVGLKKDIDLSKRYVLEFDESIKQQDVYSLFEDFEISIEYIEKDLPVRFFKTKKKHFNRDCSISPLQAVNYISEEIQLDGNGVTVAIIDTGVDYKHPYLEEKFKNTLLNFGKMGKNFTKANNGNDLDIMDDHGHGTNIAGILVSNSTNGRQPVGISKGINLLSFKVNTPIEEGQVYISNICSALREAYELGADVINNSWYIEERKESETLNQLLKELAENGCISIFGAGERGQDICETYPQNTGNVIVVGGLNANMIKDDESDWGEKVTIWAPGENIVTTQKVTNVYNPLNILTESESGTSMAATFVTATVALLKQQNKSITFKEVIEKLQSGTKQVLDEETGYEGYILDIKKTITLTKTNLNYGTK